MCVELQLQTGVTANSGNRQFDMNGCNTCWVDPLFIKMKKKKVSLSLSQSESRLRFVLCRRQPFCNHLPVQYFCFFFF